MAGRQVPASYTAGRRLNLNGVVFAKGDNIPQATIAKVKHVTALISRRWIIPSCDQFGRALKVPTRPSKFRFMANERKKLLSGTVAAPRHRTAWGTTVAQ